jgi:hypothetical protein
MLRPLIEGLGYRIAGASEAADVVIAREQDVVDDGAHVVRIRSSAEGEGIHRYDRAALIGALSAARGRANG